MSSRLLFLELPLACNFPCLLPQAMFCCSCLLIQVRSNHLASVGDVASKKGHCVSDRLFLSVEVASVAELLRKSCLLLPRLQEEVDHSHRPKCRRCASACSRCWALRRIVVGRAVARPLPGVFARPLVSSSNRRLLR